MQNRIQNGSTKEINFIDNTVTKQLFGEHNKNLSEIESLFDTKVYSRGNKLNLHGESTNVDSAEKLLKEIYRLIDKGYSPDPGDFGLASKILNDNKIPLEDIFLDTVCISTRKKLISPKSINQKLYIEAMRNHDIVFGIGPAGTGKTYLAMAIAVSSLINKEVSRIILVRPAVEAGEKLGFLPGDLLQKIDPYLRPLFDALYDMMDIEKASSLIERGTIEIVPLAYMRGRTLNDAFVVLDEAQNTTTTQMKMFLTRLGFSSRAVITGDLTQVDLPKEQKSGLVEAESLIKEIEEISFVYFSKKDVVRHPLVKQIIEAYEKIS